MANRPILKFKKLDPEATIPAYAHKTDAAFDIFTIEAKTLKKGERCVFKTGLSSIMPTDLTPPLLTFRHLCMLKKNISRCYLCGQPIHNVDTELVLC